MAGQERGAHGDLHLELSGRLTLDEAHGVADRVEARILEQLPELDRVDIHLELHEEEPDRATPVERDVREAIDARIRSAASDRMATSPSGSTQITAEGVPAGAPGVQRDIPAVRAPATRSAEA